MNEESRKAAEGILFTDQYQLTMGQLYFRMGLHEQQVQFDHFFRKCPDYGQHQAGYCVNAGMEWLLDWMAGVRFGEQERLVVIDAGTALTMDALAVGHCPPAGEGPCRGH